MSLGCPPPAPWSAELQPNYYVVRDANKQQLAYVYFENERDGDRRPSCTAKTSHAGSQRMPGGVELMCPLFSITYRARRLRPPTRHLEGFQRRHH